jgi:hypothetical protein
MERERGDGNITKPMELRKVKMKVIMLQMLFPWSCFKMFSVLNGIIVEEASTILLVMG